MFLLNSRLGLFTAAPLGYTPEEAPLLPKLRGHFAEFLNESSPDRLRILSSPTCVGLRYGHLYSSLEAFLGSVESGTSVLKFPSPSRLSLHGERICLFTSLIAWTRISSSALSLSFCVPPSFKRKGGGTGILTCCPSPTPFGLGLGPD